MRCRVACSEAMRTSGDPAVRFGGGILLSPACLPVEPEAWDKHSPWVPWARSASSVEDYNTGVEREEKKGGNEDGERRESGEKRKPQRTGENWGEMVGSSWRWLRLPGWIPRHAPIPSFACSLDHSFTHSHLIHCRWIPAVLWHPHGSFH